METTIVGDSVLYSKDNLELLKQIKWLTRVPLSIKEAKNLVSNLSDSELTSSEVKYLAIHATVYTQVDSERVSSPRK